MTTRNEIDILRNLGLACLEERDILVLYGEVTNAKDKNGPWKNRAKEVMQAFHDNKDLREKLMKEWEAHIKATPTVEVST